MKRRVVSGALSALCVCFTATAYGQGIEITLKQGSQREAQTKAQLQKLVERYDISRWIFTRSIMDFWATDHYTWVYRMVLDRSGEIGKVISKYKLNP